MLHFDDLYVSLGKETLEMTVVRGKQDLKIQGPRLNQTKEDKMTVRRGPDYRLDPIVAPPMPLLEVRVSHKPPQQASLPHSLASPGLKIITNLQRGAVMGIFQLNLFCTR